LRLSPLLLAIALAGCTGSGEPSVDNIRDALAQSGNRGAAKAEKLACKKSPERPGYVCDYRAPACNRFTGACGAARPFTGRFLYAGGRWQLVEDLTRQAAPDPVTQPLPGVALATPVPGVPSVAAPVASPSPTATPSPRPTRTQAPPPPELSQRERQWIEDWHDLDGRCRSRDRDGYGEDWDACRDQERLARRLERRNLCYAPPQGWGPCDR
jgi:hypothetical protein